MNIRRFITASEKADGVWLTFEGEDARFLIASSNRPAYTRALHKAFTKRGTSKLKADPAKTVEATIEALAESVLLGWEGVTDGEKPFPATLENKITLLRGSEAFRNFVSSSATDPANFAEAEATAEDAEAVKSDGDVGAPTPGI